MDISYVEMWTIHYQLTIVEDKSCIADTNKGYTILEDGIPNNCWRDWFKCRHLELNIHQAYKGWKLTKHKD